MRQMAMQIADAGAEQSMEILQFVHKKAVDSSDDMDQNIWMNTSIHSLTRSLATLLAFMTYISKQSEPSETEKIVFFNSAMDELFSTIKNYLDKNIENGSTMLFKEML